MLFKYAVQLLAAASCVASVEIVDEAIPDSGTLVGDLYRRFRPYLKVDRKSCCTPFPVVDGNGTIESEPIPRHTDFLKNCQRPDGEGQIYARGLNKDDPVNKWGMYAIMFAWYFPMIRDGLQMEANDWQQIVVWMSGEGESAAGYQVSHIAYSQPQGYMMVSPSKGPTNLQVLYTNMGHKNHMQGRGLIPTDQSGWPYKMVAWERFTDKAKEGVADAKAWRGKTAPFSDPTFLSHLNASAPALQ